MTTLTIKIPDQKVAAIKKVLLEMGAITVVANTKKAAKLKYEPNAETVKAMNELKAGKGKRFKSVNTLFESINKACTKL